MPGKGQKKVWPFLDPSAPGGMPALMELWVEAMRMRGLSGVNKKYRLTTIRSTGSGSPAY